MSRGSGFISVVRHVLHGQAQVVEESGRVGIALIQLIPETRGLVGVEVAGDKRGLARSGRARYPDDLFLPAAIDSIKEPLTGKSSLRLGRVNLAGIMVSSREDVFFMVFPISTFPQVPGCPLLINC